MEKQPENNASPTCDTGEGSSLGRGGGLADSHKGWGCLLGVKLFTWEFTPFHLLGEAVSQYPTYYTL